MPHRQIALETAHCKCLRHGLAFTASWPMQEAAEMQQGLMEGEGDAGSLRQAAAAAAHQSES